ncbi:MAG: SCO family protein [Chloroflexi bacterium]|nr:MAG: SCO family protein [Chloroflexota bacterium]
MVVCRSRRAHAQGRGRGSAAAQGAVRARAAFLSLLLFSAGCVSGTLAGTDLQKRPAADFTLTDGPTGDVVTLSALRGKVVILAFLYTNCPDVCPLTAEKLRDARDRLGDSAADLSLVAVSVDPRHDTPMATGTFVRAHRLEGVMRFLIGDQASLARCGSCTVSPPSRLTRPRSWGTTTPSS